MSLEKTDILTAVSIINKDFGLEKDDNIVENETALYQWLIKIINYLLEKDFERLLQAMYRIDVSEEKFKAIFVQDGNIAEAIANLVLERELKKVAIRKRYK